MTDSEITQAIQSGKITIDPPIDLTTTSSMDSQIQPSSLDLTIGEILVPPDRVEPKAISEALATQRTGLHLEPGTTAIVYTRETIRLSDDVAAFGFPPARLSRQGILITNPGHVDPGFTGQLEFTVINMGRRGFELCQGSPIATLLLYELERSVQADFATRYGVRSDNAKAVLLGCLSPDFLDVKRIARDEASAALEQQDIVIRNRQIFFPAVVLLLGVVVTAVLNLVPRYFEWPDSSDVHALELSIARLEGELQQATAEPVARNKAEIEKLRAQIAELATAFATLSIKEGKEEPR